jgi:phosphohistidine phosphatase
MAAQLWLLRHGEAEPHGTRDDADRRLTPRGEEQARAAGAALSRIGVTFQAIFTSPRVRARDTAGLASEHLGCVPIEHAALSGGFGADEAVTLVQSLGADQRVLLVGHNPDLDQIVHDMTGARVQMSKGAVAGIRLHGSRGELIVLLRPRELLPLAEPVRD